MSAIDALQQLAAGAPVESGFVLQNARLFALGREVYGEEEVIGHFKRHPLAESARIVAHPSHALLLWKEHGLWADLSGDNVMRLWRIGPGSPEKSEPNLSVPFDPDMTQTRGDVLFQASDHPALETGHRFAVEAAGRGLAREWAAGDGLPAIRAHSFCIRAFSAGDTAAALFAVHAVSGLETRQSGFVHALAVLDADATIIRDGAGDAATRELPWRPRVG